MADAVMLTPELQTLVDAGAIPMDVALEAMAASPKVNEFTGTARCLNAGCEQAHEARPVMMRKSFTDIMAVGMPVLLHRTEHLEMVDDAQINCQTCGLPCALQDMAPPVYQKLMPA